MLIVICFSKAYCYSNNNLQTCLSGQFPTLCKHNLLTPEQARQTKNAELNNNLRTCLSGQFPTLCKHNLLTPEQARQTKNAELNNNLRTCISGQFPTLCKHNLLTKEQNAQVIQAETKYSKTLQQYKVYPHVQYRPSTFNGYNCTVDCSGHEAGYEWAEENDIDDIFDCEGNSTSFIEGCESYVEENY
jgi:hypothetical protein